MGEKTDKVAGRAKQAVGAVTGDEETKREGGAPGEQGQAQGQARLNRRQGAGRARGPEGQGRQEIGDRVQSP